MKSFNKYCHEIKNKYYNCEKVIRIDTIVAITSILLLLISAIITNLYVFGMGGLCFLFFIYMLTSQRKFWFSEVPHHAYCHFKNADEHTTQILLKIMHRNDPEDPKLVNFNIFFPLLSSFVSRQQHINYSFQYCYNKSKLNTDIKENNNRIFQDYQYNI